MTAAPTRPSASPANALPPGTRLGEFEILDVLGVGGFGIVYLALDHALEREVAIKEYMPASLAGRTETLHVSVRSASDADTFALGLRSFVNEAKLLARFDHPSLLKVYRFWEANDTAYMSMPVYRGRTLKAVRSAMTGSPDEAWLRALLTPLLGAIETLHGQEVFHRDIAPDNILIEPDGRPVLLDFGAARRVIGDHSQALTAILKPAYAPIEQYAEASRVRQGPWTDLYALGATLYYALTGQAPAPSTARTLHDDMTPLAAQPLAGCSPDFLQAIDWMLAPRPADRPQSVAALREVLDGSADPPAPSPLAMAPSAGLERTRILAPVTQPPSVATQSLAAAPTMIDVSGVPPAAADLPLDLPSTSPPPATAAPAAASVAAPPPWHGAPRSRGIGPAVAGLMLAGAASAWWWWPGASAPPAVAGGASVAESVATPLSAASVATSSAAKPPAAAPQKSPVAGPSAAPSPAPPSVAAARPSSTGGAPSIARLPPEIPPVRRTEPVVDVAVSPATSLSASMPAGRLVLPATQPAATSASTPASAPVVPPPRVAAAAEPLSDQPEAICGRRVLLAQFLCMERECRTDQYAKHPACRKWWQQNRGPS